MKTRNPLQKQRIGKQKQCSAINCRNYQSTCPELAFHRFPKDSDRCARWVQNLRNGSLMGICSERLHVSYRVCSAHFHHSQFKRPDDVHAGLNWNAVPTRVNAPNPPPPLDLESGRKPPKKRQELPPKKSRQSHDTNVVLPGDTDEHTGSDTDVTAPDAAAGPSVPPLPSKDEFNDTARERALKMKVKNLQKKVCRLRAKVKELNSLKKSNKMGVSKESVLKQMKTLLPARAYAFFCTQIRMTQRKARGSRWTIQDKAFFLSLFHASPKCYRLLFKLFSMPSLRTLQRLK